MAEERTMKEFLNDIRFLADATELLHDIFEGVSREVGSDRKFEVYLDEQYFRDIEEQALLLNDGATFDGGGKDICIPPGPCDSPGGSITTYIKALTELAAAVSGNLQVVMAAIQAEDATFSADVYPERVLKWQIEPPVIEED